MQVLPDLRAALLLVALVVEAVHLAARTRAPLGRSRAPRSVRKQNEKRKSFGWIGSDRDHQNSFLSINFQLNCNNKMIDFQLPIFVEILIGLARF